MVQVLQKILALILAFIVLFTSFSFTVEKHVCMGEVTDVSYFTDADSCGMEMKDEECTMDKNNEEHMQQEKCCVNVQELIPGNQNEQQAINSFEIDQLQFILAYTYTYLNLFKSQERPAAFVYYSPPLVDKDIQILYQSFLI